MNKWIRAVVFLCAVLGSWGVNQTASAERVNAKNLLMGEVYYAGYTKKFLPVRDLLAQGNIEQAGKKQKKLLSKQKKGNLLVSLEKATISLDAGRLDESIAQFSDAEKFLNQRKKASKIGGFFKKAAGTVGGFVTGNEELVAYRGEAYERILMLNYKSIAYMLDGDRRAYNVARRSIDWQNKEKKEFDKKLKKAKKKLKKNEAKLSKKAKKDGKQSSDGEKDVLKERYSNAKALKVPSAYVNPFGFYMAGIVQEYDSYEDVSLRDNARISYGKAAELNPKSKVIKKARDAMTTPAPKGKRLLHVVAGDGFAPEKKVLKYNFYFAQYGTSMKLPLYEPIPSKVARIEVKTTKNTLLAKMDLVADIEAIAMRHQLDSLPLQRLKAIMMTVKSVFENKALEQFGVAGALVSGLRDKTSNPDMRSWMTLPRAFYAARIHVPKNLSQIKVVSYDKRGRVLAKKVVKLETKSHNFVYVRTFDKAIYANGSEKMWVAMK